MTYFERKIVNIKVHRAVHIASRNFSLQIRSAPLKVEPVRYN